MLKGLSILSRNFSGVNISRECLDPFDRLFDLGANFRSGRQGWIPQPIMSDHSLFGRIRDCPGFQRSHCCERFIDLRPHLLKEIIWEFHPADVERETEVPVIQEVPLKTLPE